MIFSNVVTPVIAGRGKGPLTIPFNGVSVLGGIQPSKMAAALSSPDDGLVDRFLWAWPNKLKEVRRPRQSADMAALENAYRRLEAISWGIDQEGRQTAVTLPLSARAADIFERWEQDCARPAQSGLCSQSGCPWRR